MPTQYLTEKELAKITKQALSTLRNNRHLRRGIPYLKLGKTIRYELADVQRYMDSRKITFEE